MPALTPVLLTYDGTGPLYLSRYDGPNPGAATDFENNLFKGSVDPGGHTMTASEMMSNFLTLGRPSGDTSYNNLGFYAYHPTDNILPSYVAWLAMSDLPAARMAVIFDDETTAIDERTLQPASAEEPQVYTLQGLRVAPSEMRKGSIYIVNGKKVIIR